MASTDGNCRSRCAPVLYCSAAFETRAEPSSLDLLSQKAIAMASNHATGYSTWQALRQRHSLHQCLHRRLYRARRVPSLTQVSIVSPVSFSFLSIVLSFCGTIV